MDPKELFVGRKVWLKPNPLYRDLYAEPYTETKVSYVGTTRFKVEDSVRPSYITYSIRTMKECTDNKYKGEILLSIDGLEDFDRKEQLIIRVRRYFNSRAVYNESEDNLNKVIKLLNL